MNPELGNLVQDCVNHVLPDKLVVIGRAGDLAVQPREQQKGVHWNVTVRVRIVGQESNLILGSQKNEDILKIPEQKSEIKGKYK